METLNTPQHRSPKSGSALKHFVKVGALVAGITTGGNALAQQNPDPVGVEMTQVVALQLQDTRKNVGKIIDRQNPKDWIMGSVFLGAPLLIAGGLLGKGRRRKDNEKKGATAREVLDSVEMPKITPKIEVSFFDPLTEALAIKAHGNDVDAIRLLSTWIDGGELSYPEGTEIRKPGIEDYRNLLIFISSTQQLNISEPTRIPGNIKGNSEMMPSKRALYAKYFSSLMDRVDIPYGAKVPYLRLGLKLDPENVLYKEIGANLSTPA